MNRYDKESTIIKDFQSFDHSDVCLLTNGVHRLYNQLHNPKEWNYWIDNSSKKSLPPDFYNEKLKLMMDVMRVDDHSFINEKGQVINPTNQRESQIFKEMLKINPSLKQAADEGHIFINPYTGLDTDEDHNYGFYVNTFNRVVKNHIDKISDYKKNHPDYKVIFFILDESSPYAIILDGSNPKNPGDGFFGQPHFWWYDKNMMDCTKDSGIDYIVWMTPYKHFENKEKLELPKAIIINLKKFNYKKLYPYDPSEMYSLER